ncbi:MAG: nucleotidyltransferase family protein [Anaerolineae bacterium]|nr:nucleotidyltransferase family protein [Anaerolineae bacterium]MCB9129920.1 nucleotidyltransferase family protein [Anaerolineales bacterium]MCB0229873.1 nucleotidyltransferase family protein [Anaerolineae bacterium]MCB0235554.1 nucleotidyltransferase family protein [Anaerolineae bacterium]MCB0241263.1 nucleotidyltransferase family protein [Anaerolineae bacterium]
MKTIDSIRTILSEHLPELRDQYGVTSIAVFGSAARGDFDETSDVDILVDFGRPIGWEIVHLQLRLEELIGSEVDLVTRNAALRKPLLWTSIQEDLVYV